MKTPDTYEMYQAARRFRSAALGEMMVQAASAIRARFDRVFRSLRTGRAGPCPVCAAQARA